MFRGLGASLFQYFDTESVNLKLDYFMRLLVFEFVLEVVIVSTHVDLEVSGGFPLRPIFIPKPIEPGSCRPGVVDRLSREPACHSYDT